MWETQVLVLLWNQAEQELKICVLFLSFVPLPQGLRVSLSQHRCSSKWISKILSALYFLLLFWNVTPLDNQNNSCGRFSVRC